MIPAAHRLDPSMMRSSQQVECQSVHFSIARVGLRHCVAPVLLLVFQISEYCLGEESGYLNLPSSISSAHPDLVVVRSLHDSYGNLVIEKYQLGLRTVNFPAISVERRTEI